MNTNQRYLTIYLLLVTNFFLESCFDKSKFDIVTIDKYQNDGIYLRGQLINGKPEGFWVEENSFGIYIKEASFKSGKITGAGIRSSDGSFSVISGIKDNKLHGNFVLKYFHTPIPHITGQFDRGKKVGKWEYLWFDKSPWVEVDYGTYEHPKKDTLLYEPRPKGEKENYLEVLKRMRIVDELVDNMFQQSLLKKREDELRVQLEKEGYVVPHDLLPPNFEILKEEITKRYRKEK